MCHFMVFLRGPVRQEANWTPQAPLQRKPHLGPNQKVAGVRRGRAGQRGMRTLFPGDQKTGDMRPAIQTRNQQTAGGVNVPGITN